MGFSDPVLCQISIVGPIRPCFMPSSWKARNGLCVYCTDKAITFVSSPWGYMAPNFSKFPLSALYGPVSRLEVGRHVTVSAIIAPRRLLHFKLSIPVVSF